MKFVPEPLCGAPCPICARVRPEQPPPTCDKLTIGNGARNAHGGYHRHKDRVSGELVFWPMYDYKGRKQ